MRGGTNTLYDLQLRQSYSLTIPLRVLKKGGCDVITSDQNRIVNFRVLDCTQIECTHTHACVGTQKLGTRNLYSA